MTGRVRRRRGEDPVSATLLRASALRPATAPVLPEDRDELVSAARFHRVAPLVNVVSRETDPQLAGLLAPDRLRAITFHVRACDVLTALGELLDDVRWVSFKGAVYSEHAHPVAGLRTYNDVDVLVAPSDLRDVTGRLLAAGWSVADFRDMLRDPQVPGEMHWMSPFGVVVDLHWSMVNTAARRRLFTIPTDELLSGRVSVQLGAGRAWTLDPVDALVHACVHAAGSGANKLVYLVDVDRLGRAVEDWGRVVDVAARWGAQAQVALVLRRAERVLGMPLPPGLFDRLGVPHGVRALMAATDWASPVHEVRRDEGLSRFVARAVRRTTAATATTTVRNAGHWLRSRRLGAQEVGSARSPGDADSLEVYLSAVESAAAR